MNCFFWAYLQCAEGEINTISTPLPKIVRLSWVCVCVAIVSNLSSSLLYRRRPSYYDRFDFISFKMEYSKKKILVKIYLPLSLLYRNLSFPWQISFTFFKMGYSTILLLKLTFLYPSSIETCLFPDRTVSYYLKWNIPRKFC